MIVDSFFFSLSLSSLPILHYTSMYCHSTMYLPKKKRFCSMYVCVHCFCYRQPMRNPAEVAAGVCFLFFFSLCPPYSVSFGTSAICRKWAFQRPASFAAVPSSEPPRHTPKTVIIISSVRSTSLFLPEVFSSLCLFFFAGKLSFFLTGEEGRHLLSAAG